MTVQILRLIDLRWLSWVIGGHPTSTGGLDSGNPRIPLLITGEVRSVSLFVDNIPNGIDRGWVRRLFERHGEVCDLFISTKKRKNKSAAFGFVRYTSFEEAEQAIAELHHHAVRGQKLWVSMAKYGKDGSPVTATRNQVQRHDVDLAQRQDGRSEMRMESNRRYAVTDERKYSDVVAGVRKQVVDSDVAAGFRKQVIDVVRKEVDNVRKELTQSMKVIPVFQSIKVNENDHNKNLLQKAIVAEKSDVLNLPIIQSEINECKVNVSDLFYLSPTKLLLVFECQLDAMNAVNIGSPLWNVFDNIELWSEGNLFDDRLVWINCIGVHPLCCTNETLKTIGELWGPVLRIEKDMQGIQSITGARILIRTKAQNKIDNRIRLLYDRGSCDVWVKEHYGGCTNNCADGKVNKRASKVQEGVALHQGNLDQSLHYAISPLFDDPLVQDAMTKTMNGECKSWVDPIVSNENIYWSDVDSGDCCFSRQIITSPTISPLRASKSSRPRGRPKKSSDQGLIEASKTWEIARTLGITVDDENAVFSGLRKSKRILILEEKGE